MNENKPTNPDSKTGLIDRRFFLKASSATVAAVAAGTLIPASIAENGVADKPVVPDHQNEPKKQWKAGWMAF
jgi:hypothetical protein